MCDHRNYSVVMTEAHIFKEKSTSTTFVVSFTLCCYFFSLCVCFFFASKKQCNHKFWKTDLLGSISTKQKFFRNQIKNKISDEIPINQTTNCCNCFLKKKSRDWIDFAVSSLKIIVFFFFWSNKVWAVSYY